MWNAYLEGGGPYTIRPKMCFTMFWQDLCIKFSYLATQRTEGESIEQAPVADLALAGVSQAFSWARLGLGLWSFIQENHSGTVDYVCLNAWYVQNLLNFWYPNHIMIRRSTYLFVSSHNNQKQKQHDPEREELSTGFFDVSPTHDVWCGPP